MPPIYTHPKSNMDLENHPSEKETHLPSTIVFWQLMLNFGGVNQNLCQLHTCQVSKFMVPQAGQVHFVFRAGGGGGGNSRPLMPRTFDSVKVKSPHKQPFTGDVVFSHNFSSHLVGAHPKICSLQFSPIFSGVTCLSLLACWAV